MFGTKQTETCRLRAKQSDERDNAVIYDASARPRDMSVGMVVPERPSLA